MIDARFIRYNQCNNLTSSAASQQLPDRMLYGITNHQKQPSYHTIKSNSEEDCPLVYFIITTECQQWKGHLEVQTNISGNCTKSSIFLYIWNLKVSIHWFSLSLSPLLPHRFFSPLLLWCSGKAFHRRPLPAVKNKSRLN